MTTTAVPQRQWGLDLANYIRVRNGHRRHAAADMNQADGLRYIADLIADRPDPGELVVLGSDAAGAMRINALLEAPLRWGPQRARRLMASAHVTRTSARVRDLTDRERMALVVQLHKCADAAEAEYRLAA